MPEERPLVKFVILFAERNYENAEHIKYSIGNISKEFNDFIAEDLLEVFL